MAKKIPTVSRWGQDTARERYQFGGTLPAGRPVAPNMPVVPPQAATALAARPALPAQAMGRRPFNRGGKGC